MPFELLSPWDDLRSWSQRPVLALVWPQRTPCQEAIKKQFGVTNLVRAICEREDVVLIAEPKYHAAIATFAQEHLGESVAFQPSHSGPGRLVAGHLTRPSAGEHLAERPGSTTAR